MTNTQAFETWVQKLHQLAQARYTRQVVVLCGNVAWINQTIDSVRAAYDPAEVLYVSSTADAAVSPKRAQVHLGQEFSLLLFDAQQEFDANALGAVAGTVCGGGLIFILLGENAVPACSSPRVIQRLLQISAGHNSVYVVHENAALAKIKTHVSHEPLMPRTGIYRTSDQQQAVEKILQVLEEHSGPMVLVSDRGRGKSSSLGIIAASLIKARSRKILITAPRLSVSEPAFERVIQLCPDCEQSRGQIRLNQSMLQFMAPDRLLQELPAADVLMIDEAAAMPLFMTQALLQHYPAVVLSTTVHGYEGTGRGFVMKFRQYLQQHFSSWQEDTLTTPVRWSANDEVEPWLNRVLCLDAELQQLSCPDTLSYAELQLQQVTPDELLANEPLLTSVFALLVHAHYRTRPSDLAQLLDDSSLRLYVLSLQQAVVGVVLVAQEGELDPELSAAIYRGDRRPPGHILAQTLTFHAGMEKAACYQYARIMRIAIHPELQSRGYGSGLLQQVMQRESARVDLVGVSFSADKRLLDFWLNNGFELVRLGFTRDHVTGRHSAVLLKPTSASGESVCTELVDKFRRYLPAWLEGVFADVDTDLHEYLGTLAQQDSGDVTASDLQEVRSFAFTHRGYEACLWPLQKWFSRCQQYRSQLDAREQQILQAKIEQRQSWCEIVQHMQLIGVSEAERLLREATAHLLALCGVSDGVN